MKTIEHDKKRSLIRICVCVCMCECMCKAKCEVSGQKLVCFFFNQFHRYLSFSNSFFFPSICFFFLIIRRMFCLLVDINLEIHIDAAYMYINSLCLVFFYLLSTSQIFLFRTRFPMFFAFFYQFCLFLVYNNIFVTFFVSCIDFLYIGPW